MHCTVADEVISGPAASCRADSESPPPTPEVRERYVERGKKGRDEEHGKRLAGVRGEKKRRVDGGEKKKMTSRL